MSHSIFNLMRSAAVAAPVGAKLKKASQDIEAIFMKDLLTAMRRTSPHKAMGSSYGSDMYMDLVDQAISQDAAKSGTLGIGKTIYRQMAPMAIQAAIRNAAASGKAELFPISGPVQPTAETETISNDGLTPARDRQRP